MIQFNYLRIYLDIDTVSRRLWPRMAMMDMDGNLTTSFGPITGADPGFFFRRGCTRVLLYFNTNKPHSFFFFFLQNTSCIRKPQVISGRGAHPLHPPPRSAPALHFSKLFWIRVFAALDTFWQTCVVFSYYGDMIWRLKWREIKPFSSKIWRHQRLVFLKLYS